MVIHTLDIEGLLKTKTDDRDKNRIDRAALQRLRDRLSFASWAGAKRPLNRSRTPPQPPGA
jgi:hypothetical protein